MFLDHLDEPPPGHGCPVCWRHLRSCIRPGGSGFDVSTGAGGYAGITVTSRFTGSPQPEISSISSNASDLGIMLLPHLRGDVGT